MRGIFLILRKRERRSAIISKDSDTLKRKLNEHSMRQVKARPSRVLLSQGGYTEKKLSRSGNMN